MGQVERLTSRVDDLEAKISYCGTKMDSLLGEGLYGIIGGTPVIKE